jgi:hypothetical protein
MGISYSMDGELTLANVSATNIHQNLTLPVQTQHPSDFLSGFIPAPHAKPLAVDGIGNAPLCTMPNVISSDDLVDGSCDNPLLTIWSAKMKVIGGFSTPPYWSQCGREQMVG